MIKSRLLHTRGVEPTQFAPQNSTLVMIRAKERGVSRDAFQDSPRQTYS